MVLLLKTRGGHPPYFSDISFRMCLCLMSWVQQVHNAAVVARSLRLGCQPSGSTQGLRLGLGRQPQAESWNTKGERFSYITEMQIIGPIGGGLALHQRYLFLDSDMYLPLSKFESIH